eukprot:gnl/TRDRNA2_/TRDRNA2_84561_c0_seq2.p2 gnl/TRDRNA2_/TRDRNA2_84561_c0~~gnl/TRDRNA2_/TRDRNA2_84561_c0_seq2.p2  ORF type:complete len:226 (-),score=34.66 gnl/TRDRNA2_/TRDRNA2_84561_c0_seq2:143-820(-)
MVSDRRSKKIMGRAARACLTIWLLTLETACERPLLAQPRERAAQHLPASNVTVKPHRLQQDDIDPEHKEVQMEVPTLVDEDTHREVADVFLQEARSLQHRNPYRDHLRFIKDVESEEELYWGMPMFVWEIIVLVFVIIFFITFVVIILFDQFEVFLPASEHRRVRAHHEACQCQKCHTLRLFDRAHPPGRPWDHRTAAILGIIEQPVGIDRNAARGEEDAVDKEG